jgi:uncharacterized protein YbjT (DUF2867 family)
MDGRVFVLRASEENDMTTILVTGATGTIGAEVVRALAQKPGVALRVASRGGKRAGDLPPGAEVVDFDWEDAAKVASAVKGVDAVFLLTPFVDVAVSYVKTLVDAAKAAGVKKIVKLSAAGAESEAIQIARWHREAERLVEASGLAWVLLRPNFYMTNFVSYYPPDKEGALYLPTGAGKAAWVHPRDVADVAAEALTRPDWDGKALDVTGPEALSVGDIATILSEVSGRTIKHVDIPAESAKQAMDGMGLPAWMVQGMLDLHAVVKNGYAAGTSTVVKDATGRPPTSFAAFARENAARFKG